MKIYSDLNINKTYKEYMYESFLEEIRTYFLEDVVVSPQDIVCASIVNINRNIYYKEFSDIIIDSIPKNKDINVSFFFKNTDKLREIGLFDLSKYNKKFDPTKDWIYVSIKIKIKTTSYIVTEVKLEDFINDPAIEDITSEYNIMMKNIYLQTSIIPFIIRIKNPEFIRTGDVVSYKFKLYSPELPNLFSINSNRLYLNITNSSLILPKEIPNGSLCIALFSAGNILRSKTINDLYRINNNLPFLVDTNLSEIIIPEKFMIVNSGRISLVPSSRLSITPQSLSSDYSIISIHIKKSNLVLDFEELANKRYYNQIQNELLNVNLKPDKYIYLGFAIVNNTGSRIIQEDLFITNSTINLSDSGGQISKSSVSSCNKSITIDYIGNTPPIVQIKDSITNDYIIPSRINYSNNKIKIDVYEDEQICYDVIIL